MDGLYNEIGGVVVYSLAFVAAMSVLEIIMGWIGSAIEKILDWIDNL